MFYFSPHMYELLSTDIQLFYAESTDQNSEQTFEIEHGLYSLLFWCSASKNSNDNITMSRWIILTFHSDIRCGHDFSIDTLMDFING